VQDDGGMIVLQTASDEFLIGGAALDITVSADPDAAGGVAGIASVEEGSRARGEWITERRLNGDQTNQGRTISLPGHQFTLLRVKLYTIPAR
jgi:beta-galactosidase GanA